MTRRHAAVAALAAACALGPAAAAADAGPDYDLLLRGGRVVDGAGNPWLRADVAVRGDRIAAIGRLEGARARRSLDATDLVIAPGFIDMLGQSEFTVLADPHLRSKITQGITTELTGEGGSVGPMTAYTSAELRPVAFDLKIVIDWTDHDGYAARLRRKGAAVNFCHQVGAAQVRMAVLRGENRAPSAQELRSMSGLVEAAMRQGAFGLSSSLIYPPGAYAGTDELVALARAAARHGGLYATHVRGESDALIDSLAEAIRIGEEAGLPVEIWHLKAAGRGNWGRMAEALRAIEAARERGVDIAADVYPYTAAATDLSACLPPSAAEGGLDALLKRLRDPAGRARIRAEMERPTGRWENLLHHVGGPEGVLVAGVRTPANREQQGRRLSEVAAARRTAPIETLFDLLVEEGGSVDAIYFLMSEDDVRLAVAHPLVSFNCDAPGVQPEGLLGEKRIHPRAYGSYPRILGRYVREQRALGLEEAVRKMTSLPAQRLGLKDRGLLREGFAADVVVFDPRRAIDRATFEDPHRFSEGIVHVLVNGVPVLESGRVTGDLPGRFLRGPGAR